MSFMSLSGLVAVYFETPMIDLLCALLGLGTSCVPEVLVCFKENQANQQELVMREAKAR